MSPQSKKYDLVVEYEGARLDRYLADHCPGLSRTRVQRLISQGYATVNNQPGKAGLKLAAGDRVSVTVPATEPGRLEPEDIPVAVLYEDADLLVVDKPAGLTVHPAPGHPDHTLVNALLSHLSGLPESGDWQRPGIVHRLDKDTSGVMLVARNERAHQYLADQFKDRTVTKIYQVLVRGHLSPEDGIIEAPVGRDPRHRERMAVVGESRGREARTEYHVLEYLGGYTLLEVRPETGRTHQIRVHLRAIGFPVAGDATYGVKAPHLVRQFVHAWKLGFRLPSTGEYREFTAELPEDLAIALDELRGTTNLNS